MPSFSTFTLTDAKASRLVELLGNIKDIAVTDSTAKFCSEIQNKITAGRYIADQDKLLAPRRVIVDFSGGLFNGADADGPATVMVIDQFDGDNQRAHVPGFEHPARPIWAGVETANVDPEKVGKAFDGIKWTDAAEDSETVAA